MQDFVPLGTGNSRSLKSSISAGTTWEQALEMLRNGTFPIDIGAVNDAGVAQKGTPLNMASLLAASVAAKYGKGAEAVPSEIFDILSKAALVGEDGGLVTPGGYLVGLSAVFGSYTGTGVYGSSSVTDRWTSITFGGTPLLLIVSYKNTGLIPAASVLGWSKGLVWYEGVTKQTNTGDTITISREGNTISWYSSGAANQLNEKVKYNYFALIINSGG